MFPRLPWECHIRRSSACLGESEDLTPKFEGDSGMHRALGVPGRGNSMGKGMEVGNHNPNEDDNVDNNGPQSPSPVPGTCVQDSMGVIC